MSARRALSPQCLFDSCKAQVELGSRKVWVHVLDYPTLCEIMRTRPPKCFAGKDVTVYV